MWDERGPLARREHANISINIDPSALGGPALHQVAMQADARLALQDLLAALPASRQETEPDWLPSLRRLRTAYDEGLVAMASSANASSGDGPGTGPDNEPLPMHPAALAQAVGRALPSDALVCYDGGHTSFWSNDLTPVLTVRTRYHDPGMSQLGFGRPYALALQWLHPGKPVFNLTGDGSFGFTLQELDTARRYALPVINVIHNNAAWGIIRHGQRKQLDFEMGTSLAGTDYAAIARGFGCHGEVVTDVQQIPAALQRASGLPAVIDCRTRFVPHPASPAFASMNHYGWDALTRKAGAG